MKWLYYNLKSKKNLCKKKIVKNPTFTILLAMVVSY